MWGQEDREAGLEIPLTAEGKSCSPSGLSYSSAKGQGSLSPGVKAKQSQALGGLLMATGPLWSEEPLSQEAQSAKGWWPLCLLPANTN